MSWILYVLLVLAVAGDILLAVVLAKVMHKNDEPQQKIDTADDFVRAVTPVLQVGPRERQARSRGSAHRPAALVVKPAG